MAIPYFRAMAYWEDAVKRAGVLNMTLSTTGAQIVQAFMESIAYDIRNTLALMRDEGVASSVFASRRWGALGVVDQLKADVITCRSKSSASRNRAPWRRAAGGLGLGVYSDMKGQSACPAQRPVRARHRACFSTPRTLADLPRTVAALLRTGAADKLASAWRRFTVIYRITARNRRVRDGQGHLPRTNCRDARRVAGATARQTGRGLDAGWLDHFGPPRESVEAHISYPSRRPPLSSRN